jgi:hypothetical protein
MSLYFLDVVLWTFGIRDHIPPHYEFRAATGEFAPAVRTSKLMQVLAAFILSAAFLSLVMCAAVWIAIQPL